MVHNPPPIFLTPSNIWWVHSLPNIFSEKSRGAALSVAAGPPDDANCQEERRRRRRRRTRTRRRRRRRMRRPFAAVEARQSPPPLPTSAPTNPPINLSHQIDSSSPLIFCCWFGSVDQMVSFIRCQFCNQLLTPMCLIQSYIHHCTEC